MAFLKSHWIVIVLVLVALASIGGMVFAHMSGGAIVERMQSVDGLVTTVKGLQRSAVNREVIDARKAEIEERNLVLDDTMKSALAMQRLNPYELLDSGAGPDAEAPLRRPIQEDVLPEPKNSAMALSFKQTYADAHVKLAEKLHAGTGPTSAQISEETEKINRLKTNKSDDDQDSTKPWMIGQPRRQDPDGPRQKRDRGEILRDCGDAVAAEKVAHGILMYLDNNAIGRHQLVETKEAPTAEAIWQAQMGLWIQQDLITAIANTNNDRARLLRKEGRSPWVGNMPVKRLRNLAIDGKLGNGGELGGPVGNSFAVSFTGLKNTDKMFIVPVQLDVIVEEDSAMAFMDRLCGIGFYTPIRVNYLHVQADPFQKKYIYGNSPVVRMIIDLEGYYFRKVFEDWIPEGLKPVLKQPDASGDSGGRRF